MWRIIGALVLLTLSLAACSSDEPSDTTASGDLADLAEDVDSAPTCTDLFTPGRPVADVVADADTAGMCERGPDDMLITGFVSWTCPDGTKVHQAPDGYGWGRDSQTWQGPDVPEPYADCVMPGTDAQHP